MLQIDKERQPELFNDERFIKEKQIYLTSLKKEEKVSFIIFRKFQRELKQLLIEESQSRCVYCEEPIAISSFGTIDNYYPKSIYPHLALDWDNLFLSCEYCNFTKGRLDPKKEGELIILHPAYDDIQSHIFENEIGQLKGKSEKAVNTISLLKLNRPALVSKREQNKLQNKLLRQLVEEGYSAANSVIDNNEYYNFFEDNIESLELLLTTQIHQEKQKQLFNNMIYANIITALETYLSDAFINTVISQKNYIKRFIKTFKDYKHIKFEYSSIFESYEEIEATVTKTLLDVIYHNIFKVKGMFKDTLEVDFPKDLTTLAKAISVRHDIVHRNGKDKTGKIHTISVDEIESLISNVKDFVKHINTQLISIRSNT
ncbi:HEPN domain-containing protein [Peribacillus frigoritolerans]|uniref:HEPN domain-containing protein n=1 Tax=Peribacillus frigoritolerans TaxID=450367 RepID=UPI003CFD56DD